MKKAQELYKEDGWWDYQPMLEAFGDVLLQVDAGCYQGDTSLIYEKDNQYGYLTFGWGSCSGCDSLQACRNIKDVQELMDSLYNDIRWFGSLEELKKYFADRDWNGTWEGNTPDFHRFISQVKRL